jgi:hypothetical protein
MTSFSKKTRFRLKKSNPELDLLADTIEFNSSTLKKHRRDAIGVPLDTEQAVTGSLFFAFWQAQIHRAERLLITCNSAIENNDPYGLAALIRAYVETTALFIATYAKFDKWTLGKMTYSEFDVALTKSVFGQRFEDLGPNREATNILTQIKIADSYIDECMSVLISSPLSLMYAALSEYAHPNFASNKQGFTLDRALYEFRMRHDGPLEKDQFDILGTLGTASLVLSKVSEKVDHLFSGTGSLFQTRN